MRAPAASRNRPRLAFFFLSPPPITETKLGQKPFAQEKSLLQLLWSISRLRPYSVSFGSTETQNDFRRIAAAFADERVDEQALLRIFHLAALAAAAFSVAQVWS
jgi:hypothetical protein